MVKVKILAAIIVAALLAVIVLQNTEQVETHILFMTVTMPRAALLSLAALFGFILGLVAAFALSRDRETS